MELCASRVCSEECYVFIVKYFESVLIVSRTLARLLKVITLILLRLVICA